MKKERIEAVKFMRVTAMMLVVLIHTTALAITTLEPSSPFYPFYLMLNRFTRFEGPVFVFLSGLVLFYVYESRPLTLKVWVDFYKKRFTYILIPYVLWSLFYEGFSYYFDYRSYEGIAVILKNILYGQSFYQLYFIFILVQLYFVLPIFIYLIKKFQFVKKYLFVIGFLLEFISQVLIRVYDVTIFPSFMVYIGSFLLGGWVAIYYPQLKGILTKKYFLVLFILTIGLGLVYTGIVYYQNLFQKPFMSYPYFKFIAMAYYLIACYFLFKVSLWLEKKITLGTNNLIENIAVYSFGFYLVHPFILVLWEKVLVAQTPMQFHLFIFLRFGLVVLSCYLFIRTFHILFPRIWMVFGKLPARVSK